VSALIVKRYRDEEVRGSGEQVWRIIRQSERLRSVHSDKDLSFDLQIPGLRIISAGRPQWTGGTFYIRGRGHSLDMTIMHIPKTDTPKFKKAVIELNKKYSNNSEIEEDAVILED
jgi:hypothetical protein